MKRNHSLLEYTRDNDTQVSKLGPSGPSCLVLYLFELCNDLGYEAPKRGLVYKDSFCRAAL